MVLAGVGIVFRQQIRSRSFPRDLIWATCMLCALFALSGLLKKRLEPGDLIASGFSDLLRSWLTSEAIGAAMLFLPFAAVLGASSIPPLEQFETTQSALLTRLRPIEIGVGRLMAALRPVVLAVGMSCGFWIAAQCLWRFIDGPLGGIGPVLTAHLVLLSASLMVGAIGALFAVRSQPGRAWGQGTAVALSWAALCITMILLVNPQVRRMNDPIRLIEGSLLVNPIVATTTSFKLDLMRTRWLYAHSDASSYEYAYPSPWESALLYLIIAAGAESLAAVRLRRAYQ